VNKGERIKDVARRLEKWAATLAEFDRQVDAFSALTRAQPDSPLLEAIYRVEEAYTAAVAEQVGDVDQWLVWFRWECEMGRTPREASIRTGARMVKVSTLKQLARVVVG